MPKYLEMSAMVGLNSDSKFEVDGVKDERKKVIPYCEDGKQVGYVITSPKTGRNVLILESENTFNGNVEFPSFANALTVPQDENYPEEHFAVLNGTALYITVREDGSPGITEFHFLPDCEWKENEGL